MSALRLNRQIPIRLIEHRYWSSLATKNEEYTATPQYPPILDLSYEKVKERKKEEEYEKIKNVKTVEEKQIKLNMPRYYGFKCYILEEDYIPYNNLPLVQHVTRTHLIENKNLPDFYNKIDVEDKVKSLKADLEELALFELEGYRRIHDIKKQDLDKIEAENLISLSISKQINRFLLNNLSQDYPHLKDVQIDFDSRIESFWYAGGMNPPENVRKSKRGQEWQKDKADEPVDRLMYYTGKSNIALRANKPLLPVVSLSESENQDLHVPYFEFDPRTVGIRTDFKHIANVPGFWPGDPNEFGLLSYHRRGHMFKRHYNDPEDDKCALHRHGIISSFGWLNAQANMLGFTTFNDITYPLVNQSIITNGKVWSFYVYQLNTIVNHSKYFKENPKRNICWATPELQLFENVDDKGIGLNEEVLRNLLKFYANAPEDRLGVNLRPYLSTEEKVCADYKDDEKREWLEREYKFLVSNRPRHMLQYEVYAWEKIYKIDNETRFMDKKTRPFELRINPWARTLDDRKPRYIPRAHRPHLPRNKGRDAPEFWP